MEIQAIVGLSKNVGKTTFLNKYLHEIKDKNNFILTSVGWDGELVDHIFGIPKPPIKVYKNNYIATYQKLINQSFKELFLTDLENFFLGKLGVYECINEDYVQIAGPSSSKELEIFIDSILKNNFKVSKLILDGAADRRYILSFANTVILITGPTFSSDYDTLLKATLSFIKLFFLPIANNDSNNFYFLSSLTSITNLQKNKNYILDDPGKIVIKFEELYYILNKYNIFLKKKPDLEKIVLNSYDANELKFTIDPYVFKQDILKFFPILEDKIYLL
ncbi:MAG: hypothetical protein ACP5RD_07045 [bacterium]